MHGLVSNAGWLGLLCLPFIHCELPGPDVHLITSCSQGGTAVSCVLTHKFVSRLKTFHVLI